MKQIGNYNFTSERKIANFFIKISTRELTTLGFGFVFIDTVFQTTI